MTFSPKEYLYTFRNVSNFPILRKNVDMKDYSPNSRKNVISALSATVFFALSSIFFFLPAGPGFKIAFPVGILTAAAIWLCPWQIVIALLFSAIGDYMGSCGNVIAQMACFAVGHVSYIVYFIGRYRNKVRSGNRMSARFKGFLTMVVFCASALLAVVFIRIVPAAPEGVMRIGTGAYASVICTMLVAAMLQRSSLYALGAVLFVFSDFILAWNMFVEPVPYARYLIMVPYYLAQWLLFIRSTSFRVAPEMRLMRF